MQKVRFKKPGYLPVGAVISLTRAEYAHRREQVSPVENRKGLFRVNVPTGFLAGMEAKLQEIPPALIAGGAVEELRHVDS